MNIGDGSLTIMNGDELWFARTRQCTDPEAKLYRTYSRWMEDEYTPEPTDSLTEGIHYFICYYSSAHDLVFPMAQIYLAEMIDKIDPAELTTFLTEGVSEYWDFSGGDQSYGDTILFSEDCNAPNDYNKVITRGATGGYEEVDVTTFAEQLNVMFCHRSSLKDPSDLTYDLIRYSEYKIVRRPPVSTVNWFTVTINYDTRPMVLNGPLTEYDYIVLSWKGNPWAD